MIAEDIPQTKYREAGGVKHRIMRNLGSAHPVHTKRLFFATKTDVSTSWIQEKMKGLKTEPEANIPLPWFGTRISLSTAVQGRVILST